MADDNYTSYSFGSSGMRVVRPGRVDPPLDPNWHLPTSPVDEPYKSPRETYESIVDTIDDLRGLTSSLSGLLPENLQPDQYLRVNPSGDEIVFSALDIDEVVTDYVSLTDTPNELIPNSYLRVNASGSGIEHIKTAPPDGGVGDNNTIQDISNFAGKLPDQIIVKTASGAMVVGRLYHINGTSEADHIHYSFNEYQGNQYMAYFKNDATGSGGYFSGVAISAGWSFFDGATTLQQVVDSGNAIYHGQKSGTSGIGANSWLRQEFSTPKGSNNVSNRFYTDIPDCILMRDGNNGGGYWLMPFDSFRNWIQ